MRKKNNKPAKITGQANNCSVKDKRLLVLFVLLTIIVFKPFVSVISQDRPTAFNTYIICNDAVYLGSDKMNQEQFESCTNLATEGVIQTSRNDFSRVGQQLIPPRFALFFNIPFLINRASQQELSMLPGIGPHTASKIYDHRLKHGDFKNIDDILRVPGIGPKRAAKLMPLISFSS